MSAKQAYATPADWDRHRERIGNLYGRMTLARVIAVMEEEHGFRATPRMYKQRLEKWGVATKNKRPSRSKQRASRAQEQPSPQQEQREDALTQDDEHSQPATTNLDEITPLSAISVSTSSEHYITNSITDKQDDLPSLSSLSFSTLPTPTLSSTSTSTTSPTASSEQPHQLTALLKYYSNILRNCGPYYSLPERHQDWTLLSTFFQELFHTAYATWGFPWGNDLSASLEPIAHMPPSQYPYILPILFHITIRSHGEGASSDAITHRFRSRERDWGVATTVWGSVASLFAGVLGESHPLAAYSAWVAALSPPRIHAVCTEHLERVNEEICRVAGPDHRFALRIRELHCTAQDDEARQTDARLQSLLGSESMAKL